MDNWPKAICNIVRFGAVNQKLLYVEKSFAHLNPFSICYKFGVLLVLLAIALIKQEKMCKKKYTLEYI